MGGINQLVNNLTGYYAFGAFDPQGNLHVARDKIAWLFMAKVPELDTYIFATTRDLIEGFCENFELERSTIEEVKSDIYMVFNRKGELKSISNISSRGYDTYSQSLANKSLSYMETMFNETELAGEESKLTDDENFMLFLNEAEKHVDDTYEIIDWNGRTITALS